MAGLSLAQQIAQLNDTAPPDVDIEQLDGGLGDASGEENLSAGRDHYLDVGVSSLRRERDALVDPKYEGTRTSRSQLYEFSDASDDAEQDSDEGSGSGHESSNQESTDQEDEERLDRGARTEISEQDREPDASREDPFPPYDNTHESVNNSLAATLKRTREADKTKGQAIVRQRSLWDSLLEARIRMQKTVANGNRLPHPDHLAPYVTSDDGQIAVQLLLKEALALSEDLFTLRSRLLRINEPEADVPPPKRQKIDTVDTIEEQTRDSTNSATTLDSIYHTSCVRTLQKWSSKIAAATPTPSTRGKSFRGGRAARSTVELIEDALGESATNMGGKAVGRTRVRRTDGARIGTLGGVNGDGSNGVERPEDGVEGDAEVFDDLDFYQSLLRDVIDSRTGTNGVEDWTTKQRLKKAKKVVDTKASKGRKLRYDVHEKLQNFMVPVPAGSWHEEQIDELFGNLLGRGTVVGDNVIIA